MPINYVQVSEVLAQNKVRIEKCLVEPVECGRFVSASPFCGSQRSPGIGKVRRPMQRQSSVAGLALQRRVHRPMARPGRDAPGRDVGMSLERQLDDVNPVPYED